MKRILLFIAAVALSYIASAQCTPDSTLKKPGLKPDRLPNGIVGTLYGETVTLFVPLDTTIFFNGTYYKAIIDSASVVELTHMPVNFGYTCDKPSRTWKGGTRGCARLYGTPVTSDTGDYVIKVKVRTFFKVVGLPNQMDQLDSSTIDFKVVMPTALQEVQQSAGMKIYPNPAKNELVVEPGRYDLSARYAVYNLMGQEMSVTPEFYGNTGTVKFNLEQMPAGVYIIKSEAAGSSWQQRFVKE